MQIPSTGLSHVPLSFLCLINIGDTTTVSCGGPGPTSPIEEPMLYSETSSILRLPSEDWLCSDNPPSSGKEYSKYSPLGWNATRDKNQQYFFNFANWIQFVFLMIVFLFHLYTRKQRGVLCFCSLRPFSPVLISFFGGVFFFEGGLFIYFFLGGGV